MKIAGIYNPFDRFSFNNHTCFLNGERTDRQLSVFPSWLLKQFQLEDKPFKLLDERIVTYKDITVPISGKAEEAIPNLEEKIEAAFSRGYSSVKDLDEQLLFQWIGKLVYGIIHFEIRAGIRQQHAIGEEFNFSQSLIHKFGNLQMMLQSLTRNVVFEGVLPWSILIFPLDNPDNTFGYRDEINTLTFSLKLNDFGIIACLQDNGANRNHHREILGKVEGKRLHPIQFEELCAKFYYSAYLFNRLPEYTFLPTDEAVFVESMPFYSISGKPLFDSWQNKTYGQVLENFWKPWDYTLFEIIKDPEKPLSFLTDAEENFIESDALDIKDR